MQKALSSVFEAVRLLFQTDAPGAGAEDHRFRRTIRIGALAAVAVFSIAACYAGSINLGFSADGANCFMRILEYRTFKNSNSWSRMYGDYALQWPIVLAIKAGVTNMPTLRVLFHFGLYLPFLLSFLICWYAVRPLNNDALLLFPLASFLLVSLPAASVLVGPSHVLAVVVWPILFLLLRPQLNSLDAMLLLGLLLVLTRTYETVVTSSLVLLGLIAVRLRVDSRVSRPVLYAAALLLLTAFGIAAYAAIFFPSSDNRGSFIDALLNYRVYRYHPMFVFSAISLFLVAASVHLRRWYLAGALALAFAGASIALPLIGRVASASNSFSLRALTLTLLPLLLIAAVWFQWKRPRISAAHGALACAVLMLLSMGYTSAWTAWGNFRHDFLRTLESSSGYVPVDATSVANNAQRWRWTMPLLSVIWSNHCVRTVIMNRPDPRRWEPLDPYKFLPLQAYVSYTATFAAATPNASRCQ